MQVNNELENLTKPRAWTNSGTFTTYEDALKARDAFLKNNSKMEAKIRRRHSKNNYSLKTRLLAEFVKQETKKSGKNKRRNKKNTNDGKFDPSAVV